MNLLSTLWHDLRYSCRRLASRPIFVVVVALTLATGVGVNVAMYSLVEQILLRPLPVPEPEQLVNLTDPGPDLPGAQSMTMSGSGDAVFSYPLFRDLEREQESFVGIAAHRFTSVSLSTGAESNLDNGFLVSASYFPVLGLTPTLGRLFGPEDDRVAGQPESVVLSHAYWQSAFGADPGVLGRTLIVNGNALTIVGVAPPGFHGTTVGLRASVFLPISFRWLDVTSDDSPDDRTYRWLYLFARLTPDTRADRALSAINSRYRAILSDVEAPLYPGADAQELEQFRSKTLSLEPGARGQSLLLTPIRERLQLLVLVSAIVLLLCCANIVGLILIRAAARQGEMALRGSLGAGRGRLVSLLLAESLVLAVPAAVASLPIAVLTLRSMAAGMGELAGIPAAAYEADLQVGAAVIAIGMAITSALVVGLIPSWRLTRTEPVRTIYAAGDKQTADKAVTRFNSVLAAAQVAVSMALLAMTGVFAQSLANIGRIDLGFDPESVVMFSLSPGTSGYSSEVSALLYDRLEQELAAIPGVESVASSEFPWLSGFLRGAGVRTPGADTPSPTLLNYVSHGLFATLDVELLAGRDFTPRDASGAPEVAIVNQSFSEQFGLGPDPIGKRITVGRSGSIEIVGLAAEAKHAAVTAETGPLLYRPRRQTSELASATFYVRSDRRADDLINEIRATVARVDPAVPINGIQTMGEQVQASIATERFVTGTATAFAVLATVLAGLGLYGVLAYGVAQRSREIGLRFALGAPVASVREMVFRRVVPIAIAGIVLGSAAAFVIGRAASSLLFGIEGTNPLALAGAAGMLLVITLVAAYVPARRASRIAPTEVLRYE